MSEPKQSIEPTYDSRETGPRFHVTSTINGRPVVWREQVEDPFVRHTLHVSVLDLLKGIFRRRLTVEVTVGGDLEVMDDVLELDVNQLVPGRTRRLDFHRDMHKAIARFGKEQEAAEADQSGGAA
jgi:hypothetical protein